MYSQYRYRRNNSFEITKREILFSIIIVSILLVLGFIISNNISDSLLESYQKYNTAIQINNEQDLFEYNIRTEGGNALVYGDLKAVDTVTYDELDNEYMYIKKVKERYTQHTRTYTTTDGKGHTQVHTETYWTWDEVKHWEQHSKQLSFLNVVFDYDKIPIPSAKYITTQKESYYIRYVYYGVNKKLTGTIYTFLKDNTISSTQFFQDKNIQETLDSLESGWELIAFWIGWIILIAGVVFGFYYLDNKWLEDKRNN